MISNERLTKALTYLAETDEECARRLGYYEGLKDQKNTIYSECYADQEGDTVKDREMGAYRDERYKYHISAIGEARVEYETVRLKRKTEEIIVEAWRSMNANRRVGNI